MLTSFVIKVLNVDIDGSGFGLSHTSACSGGGGKLLFVCCCLIFANVPRAGVGSHIPVEDLSIGEHGHEDQYEYESKYCHDYVCQMFNARNHAGGDCCCFCFG